MVSSDFISLRIQNLKIKTRSLIEKKKILIILYKNITFKKDRFKSLSVISLFIEISM